MPSTLEQTVSQDGQDTPGTSDVLNAASPEPKQTGFDFNAVIRRAFGRVPAEVSSEPVEEQTTTEDAAASDTTTSVEPAEPKSETPPPFKVFGSKEEYDAEIERKAQAEWQRVEAKRKQEEQKKKRQELRDTDPYAFAELDKEQEASTETAERQAAEFGRLLNNVAQQFDRSLLDPVVLAIDEKARTEIMKDAPPGIEGRAHILNKALDAIRKQARDEGAKDAEAKLRNNPAFRKQLLAELRESEEEPELSPATASPGAVGKFDFNREIRRAFGRA